LPEKAANRWAQQRTVRLNCKAHFTNLSKSSVRIRHKRFDATCGK
jgi:hypothetical protein